MTLDVGEAYRIRIETIGDDHFSWLRQRKYAGWVIIMDEHTKQYCFPLINNYLAGEQVVTVTVAQGERHKHLETCRDLWEELFRAGAGRRWCCLNLGGGVIGDMGGFVASTFKRGMDFVQIPTTLLSQVDASVGGKLGIDFFGVKNSIGLFADPVAVWIDPRFLSTLPDREIRSGFAEVVKHALIADAAEWERLQAATQLDHVDWASLIGRSVDIKRRIVLDDPLERGARKALNFGHTIGHAVESYLLEGEDRLLHGEAIAVGMICESWLSHRAGRLSAHDLDTIVNYLIRLYGHPEIPEAGFPAMIGLMRQDKKNDADEINFTFLDSPGRHVVNETATPEVIQESLRYYNRIRIQP
ncbi:3-dehydroquinate synthase [Neolewinella xylanilytica]|uniref:3-dehydroquinate synthase n=1 Tax=Neolewinella xylanilytica TaxID=1514080 RepID=A0A2S6I0N8_9BACT|nr:3-dehydroquinate synthase [Neolewinella xylanilytica]PPK84399.1 3-dehydroquinate synthase [Neolewinella xylanilytica]